VRAIVVGVRARAAFPSYHLGWRSHGWGGFIVILLYILLALCNIYSCTHITVQHRQLTYRWNHVENRKTNMPFKLPADVGTSSELRKPFVHRWAFLRSTLGRVTTRPRVIRYGTILVPT
jgi:hypothetical protein